MKKLLLFAFIMLSLSLSAQNHFVRQVNTQSSGTIAINNTGQDVVLYHSAPTLLATATIALPANPVDGQIVIICSEKGITLLTISSSVGTIIGVIAGITPATPASYMWFADLNKWIKLR